jgi:hypothetical protein
MVTNSLTLLKDGSKDSFFLFHLLSSSKNGSKFSSLFENCSKDSIFLFLDEFMKFGFILMQLFGGS